MLTNLKILRVKYDLTQEEMAAKCGVNRITYHKIENGKSKGSGRFWLAVQKAFPNENLTELSKARATNEE